MAFFRYFNIYYNRVGGRIFLIFLLVLLTGVLEAAGLSLLAPILGAASGVESGDMLTVMVRDIFEFLPFSMNLTTLLVFMLVVIFLKAALNFLQIVYSLYLRTEIRKNLQREISRRYAKVHYEVHISQNSGEINNLIVSEVPRFLKSFMEFTKIPVSIVYVIIYLQISIIIDWQSTLLIAGFGAIVALILRPVVRLSRETSRDFTIEAGSVQSKIIEYIQGIIYLRATNNVEFIYRRLSSSINRLGGIELRNDVLNTIVKVVNEPLAALILAFLIYQNVVVGDQELTAIMLLVFALHRLLARILMLQGEWQRFNAFIGSLEKVEGALSEFDQNTEIRGENQYRGFEHSIRFKHVSLTLGGKKILNDINLDVEKNKTIGIVGPSGAGKSSFFNIITGLVAPTSGEILVDGEPFSKIEKTSFRQTLGFVPQDPVIFNDTLLNNINLWRLPAEEPETEKKVKEALMSAGCERLIPQMYSVLGERGIRLSGGERQRIAIAREILFNPDILILDEATSALDSHSEEIIQSSIKLLRNKCTVLIIAHRLSTVVDCDMIYTFDRGNLVGAGTFSEQYEKKDSLFHSLCMKQGVFPKS